MRELGRATGVDEEEEEEMEEEEEEGEEQGEDEKEGRGGSVVYFEVRRVRKTRAG